MIRKSVYDLASYSVSPQLLSLSHQVTPLWPQQLLYCSLNCQACIGASALASLVMNMFYQQVSLWLCFSSPPISSSPGDLPCLPYLILQLSCCCHHTLDSFYPFYFFLYTTTYLLLTYCNIYLCQEFIVFACQNQILMRPRTLTYYLKGIEQSLVPFKRSMNFC